MLGLQSFACPFSGTSSLKSYPRPISQSALLELIFGNKLDCCKMDSKNKTTFA